MITFGKKLMFLRKMRGMDQAQIAEALHVTRNAVSQWENDHSEPGIDKIRTLAALFKVSTDELIGVKDGKGSFDPTPQEITLPKGAEPMPKMEALPVLGKAAANHNAIFAEAKETELVDVKYSKKDHYCLKVIGRSMAPTMYEGDTIVVQLHPLALSEFDEFNGPANPKPWLALHKKVVVASINGEDATIKRMLVFGRRDTGFKIILSPDNRSADPIEIHREHNLRILGVVKLIMREPSNFE